HNSKIAGRVRCGSREASGCGSREGAGCGSREGSGSGSREGSGCGSREGSGADRGRGSGWAFGSLAGWAGVTVEIREVRYDDPDVRALVALALGDLSERYGGSGDDTPVSAAQVAPPPGRLFVRSG